MKRVLLLTVAVFLVAAETVPRPGAVDPHIQHVLFNPEQVVSLRGALGWQIEVEFGGDERIENVSIGDSLAWQVTPNKRARMLFLKPLLRNGATNMTVVTSKRRYAFSLSTGARQAWTPWVLQFEYPPAPVLEMQPKLLAPVRLDFAYARTGDPAVMPTRVWNDGRQTYFEFDQQTPFPAIFAAGPGKKDESLVNISSRGRIQVVQQMGERFILRSGSHVAAVTRIHSR